MKRDFYLNSSDGVSKIHVAVWEPEGEIKGILQIAHGMAEYIERYAGLGEYLNARGILVAGNDHIGHGKSAAPENYGYFGKSDGWKRIIDDIELVRKELDAQYPGHPHWLLGHSMGSFVTRCYLAMYGSVSKAIIMGTAGNNPATGAGTALVKLLRGIKGERHKSPFITKMAFGSYNKQIENPVSDTAWLSRNLDNIAKYDADPACGFMFTLAGYQDLFSFLKYMNSDECYSKISKNIPIFICAGGDDPVGEYGKGPKEVFDKISSSRSAEDAPVEIKLYDGYLHEILNEEIADEVMNDCYQFLIK